MNLTISQINLDVHIRTKVNTFTIYNGGLGNILAEAEDNLKKNQNKMEAFPLFLYIFFCFLSGLPKSPKL